MRPYRDYRTASKESYKKFCAEFPEVDIDFGTYKTIITEYNKSIADHILETGETVLLPWGIGPITIIKYKKTQKVIQNEEGRERYNYSINWKETKKAGKYVYHLNLHTSGFSYRWFWSPKVSNIRLPHTWEFLPAREHKRRLAAILKEPGFKFKDVYRVHVRKRHFK